MNDSRLDEIADLAHRLEDLQFEIHALLDAEQTEPDAERSGTAVQVLTSALSHVGTAVADLDSLMPAAAEGADGPDDDELTDELIDSPGG
ncbi:MAG TPA: hypothetical protein VEY69_14705 [Lautropia sp.]|jgi:hypothetical protein|nr:hypothetical protein [Lautropia sp.]